MKICFVCCEYPPCAHGGIGTLTQMLARNLVRAGHEVRVAGIRSGAPRAAACRSDEGVRVWEAGEPGHRLGWIGARYELFRMISGWCGQGAIDLVEVPDYQGWAANWPALPVPVVSRLNGCGAYFAREMGVKPRRTTYWLERASLRRADAWCSSSRYTAEKTRQVFALERPGTVIYNPVELPPPASDEARSRSRVVFSGTLTAKKGVLSLARAWPSVVRVRPDAELHIFGKELAGSSMRERLVQELGAEYAAAVHFHGHVARDVLFDELRRARAAVFPSYAEAFAIAPLEAMACGCPTVYSERGSGPELMEHGRDGLLIDPDRPGEIAGALLLLLNHDETARRLGHAGRERVEQAFTIGRLLGENLAFYQQCRSRFAGRSKAA